MQSKTENRNYMVQIENQKKNCATWVGKYDYISGGENCTIIILPSNFTCPSLEKFDQDAYYDHHSTVPIIFGPSS